MVLDDDEYNTTMEVYCTPRPHRVSTVLDQYGEPFVHTPEPFKCGFDLTRKEADNG